jgi:hypothetical protein
LPKLFFLSLIVLGLYAQEAFQEQIPLQMATPNINQEQSPKWIPLSSVLQETPIKNTKTSPKTIDESIKNQIQKKMQSLLKPLKDDEDE